MCSTTGCWPRARWRPDVVARRRTDVDPATVPSPRRDARSFLRPARFEASSNPRAPLAGREHRMAVASALGGSGEGGVRVWQITSEGQRPPAGRPSPGASLCCLRSSRRSACGGSRQRAGAGGWEQEPRLRKAPLRRPRSPTRLTDIGPGRETCPTAEPWTRQTSRASPSSSGLRLVPRPPATCRGSRSLWHYGTR